MWMALGACAVIAAILNVVWMIRKKDGRWFGFISLSLTILTLCAIYGAQAKWVLGEDWSALTDVVPAMSGRLWACAAASILINGVSMFKKSDR